MISRMMKKYALSREGAVGLARAVAACTVEDLVLMFPEISSSKCCIIFTIKYLYKTVHYVETGVLKVSENYANRLR